MLSSCCAAIAACNTNLSKNRVVHRRKLSSHGPVMATSRLLQQWCTQWRQDRMQTPELLLTSGSHASMSAATNLAQAHQASGPLQICGLPAAFMVMPLVV